MQESHPQLRALLTALGITPQIIDARKLPLQTVATRLDVAETDQDGRAHLLIPEASHAWRAMKRAAAADGVVIEIVSAFRDLARQADIIRTKLARGLELEQILTLSAAPGYSEHHSGRAVDINTPGCAATEEPFEDTAAFDWLGAHAQRFGFTLSYPRGNAVGFIYEPWHWCYQPGLLTAEAA